MVNTAISLFFSTISYDTNGEVNTVDVEVPIYSYIEKRGLNTMKQNEGVTNKTTLFLLITDVQSMQNIENQSGTANYLIYENLRYTIAEIKKLYTHIEIQTQ